MATLISALITRAREPLLEDTASFWSDAELLVHALAGISDMWRRVIDLHQEHYLTVDETNVSLAANATTLTGIPSTAFRIISIDVRDPSSSTTAGCEFVPRDWNHPDSVNARRSVAVDPGSAIIPYTVTGQGPPVGTLTVRVAQKVTSAVNLTVAYIPTHGATTTGSDNPIPGESDKAIEAYIVAHARAKEREDRMPDPAYLAIFESEVQKILKALTPRQEQELDQVEGMFEGM